MSCWLLKGNNLTSVTYASASKRLYYYYHKHMQAQKKPKRTSKDKGFMKKSKQHWHLQIENTDSNFSMKFMKNERLKKSTAWLQCYYRKYILMQKNFHMYIYFEVHTWLVAGVLMLVHVVLVVGSGNTDKWHFTNHRNHKIGTQILINFKKKSLKMHEGFDLIWLVCLCLSAWFGKQNPDQQSM